MTDIVTTDTAALIEAVKEPRRYYIGRNRDHERVMTEMTERSKPFLKIPEDEWVRASDHAAVRDATEAVLADLIACRHEGRWLLSAGENAPMALNKVLPNARALLEKVRT